MLWGRKPPPLPGRRADARRSSMPWHWRSPWKARQADDRRRSDLVLRDVFPTSASLRAEQRVDHAHVGDGVLDAIGQRDLAAHRAREGFALQLVLVARRQCLGRDSGAFERAAIVDRNA